MRFPENVRIEIRSAFFSYVRSTAARSFSFISALAPSEAVMELGTCSENGISFSVISESGLTGKRASVSFSPTEVSA